VVFNHIKKPAKAGRKTQNLTYQVMLRYNRDVLTFGTALSFGALESALRFYIAAVSCPILPQISLWGGGAANVDEIMEIYSLYCPLALYFVDKCALTAQVSAERSTNMFDSLGG